MKILLSTGLSTEVISVPPPTDILVDYMSIARPDVGDSKRFVAHILALRTLVKSKSPGAIIWEDDLLFPICRFPSISKLLFTQSTDMIVLSAVYPGTNVTDDDLDLDGLNSRKITREVKQRNKLSIRAYWISREYAFRCLAIFDRPFYAIATEVGRGISIDRLLDLSDNVSIVSPPLFYLKDPRLFKTSRETQDGLYLSSPKHSGSEYIRVVWQ